MMMKTRLFPSLALLAVVLAACAPAATPVVTAPPIIVMPSQTPVPVLQTATQPVGVPTDSPAPTVLPLATSRGPGLHATDPSTVSLASGQLQLVEFFRFT